MSRFSRPEHYDPSETLTPVPGRWVAEISPLRGKYYGTVVRGYDPDGNDFAFDVWHSGNYKPSRRELEDWDEEENGAYEICDSHFESERCLEMCERIVRALNES